MKIQIDFYKESGKWYDGGVVDIGEARLWQGEKYRQAIVDHQNILIDGWQDEESFYVVTDDFPETSADPNYRDFFKALFRPGAFRGLVRKS